MRADCTPPPQIAALDIDVGAIPTMWKVCRYRQIAVQKGR